MSVVAGACAERQVSADIQAYVSLGMGAQEVELVGAECFGNEPQPYRLIPGLAGKPAPPCPALLRPTYAICADL